VFGADEDVHDRVDQYVYRITMDEVMKPVNWIILIMMWMFDLIVYENRDLLFQYVLIKRNSNLEKKKFRKKNQAKKAELLVF
jgi:hypothetical protein